MVEFTTDEDAVEVVARFRQLDEGEFMKYSKFIIAFLFAAGQAGVAAFAGDGHISPTEGVNIAIAGFGALTIYFGPNVLGVAVYTKAIMAGVMAGLMALATYISGGVTGAEGYQIGMAVINAVIVLLVPNSGGITGFLGSRAG